MLLFWEHTEEATAWPHKVEVMFLEGLMLKNTEGCAQKPRKSPYSKGSDSQPVGCDPLRVEWPSQGPHSRYPVIRHLHYWMKKEVKRERTWLLLGVVAEKVYCREKRDIVRAGTSGRMQSAMTLSCVRRGEGRGEKGGPGIVAKREKVQNKWVTKMTGQCREELLSPWAGVQGRGWWVRKPGRPCNR